MCVFVDPHSFGGAQPAEEIRGMLRLGKIPTISIRKNDDLGAALAQRPI